MIHASVTNCMADTCPKGAIATHSNRNTASAAHKVTVTHASNLSLAEALCVCCSVCCSVCVCVCGS